jgi:hypothetical protein
MAGEVISSLEVAKAKFKQHLTSVPEYRALLAIEKLIRDVSIDLGVAEATPAPTMPATAEHEMPPEPASIQAEPDLAEPDFAEPDLGEPDLAESTSERAIPQPEAAEIASTEPAAETQAEPDLVVSASEPTPVQPEAAVVAPDQQIVATQAERDLASLEHAIGRTGLAEIAFAGPMTAAQNEHSSDPVPAKQGAAAGGPAWDKAPAALEDLDDFDEPPAAPSQKGSDRAA